MTKDEEAALREKIMQELMMVPIKNLEDLEGKVIPTSDTLNILYSCMVRFSVEMLCRVVIFTGNDGVISQFLKDVTESTVNALMSFENERKENLH